MPGAGWVDFDPTNDQFVNDRYVTTAWGRDYRDVSPVKGVIYTESKKDEMKVSVDVMRVDGSDLTAPARVDLLRPYIPIDRLADVLTS